MSRMCRSAVLGCLAMLVAGFMCSSQVEARQRGFGVFFFAPLWSYGPPRWRQRYYAPPRKRKVVRSERRKFTQSANRRAALAIAKARKAERMARELPHKTIAVPNGTTAALASITCEKAQAIVAEFGFKQIKTELCIGENFEFHATRDGKPFLIEIEAANGELAKVQRLR